MLKVNTYLRKLNIETTRFSDENIADLIGALQSNILLDCNVYYWSSNTTKKLALEKQSKAISERNKGFVKKAVQYASSVKDIAKLPLKLLWFLKVCNQAWLKSELDGQKSKLTINYIQNTKISAVSLDELLGSFGVCKKIQAADKNKLFLPLDILKMIFMEPYKVCLAPDFKWVTDDSEVEQKIELGGEVVDAETSSA